MLFSEVYEGGSCGAAITLAPPNHATGVQLLARLACKRMFYFPIDGSVIFRINSLDLHVLGCSVASKVVAVALGSSNRRQGDFGVLKSEARY